MPAEMMEGSSPLSMAAQQLPAATPGGEDQSGLSALRSVAYGADPQAGSKLLDQDPIDPSTKWLAYASAALKPGNFSTSMAASLGALADTQSKESELKAKYLPLVANAMIQRQMQQFTMAQNQFKMTQGWNDALTGQLTGLLSKDTKPTIQDAAGVIHEATQKGLVPGQFAQQFFSNLPQNPVELEKWIRANAISLQDAGKRLETITPTVKPQETGGGTVFTNTNPNAGTTPVGQLPNVPAIPKTLTPGERLPVRVETPSGNMTVDPVSGKAGVTGGPGGQAVSAGAMAGMPQAGAPGAAPAGGPAAAAPPVAPAAVPSVPLSKDPMRQKYDEAAGTDAAKYETDLNTRVGSMRDLQSRIEEMRGQMKDFRPGAAADTRLKIGSWAKDLASTVGMSPEKAAAFGDKLAGGNVASMQDFQKVAVTGAMEALRSAMNSGRITQGEFAVFQKNNPSITMDPDGLDKVMNFLSKQYQLTTAEQKAFNKYKASGEPLDQWQAHWNDTANQLGLVTPSKNTGSGQGTTSPKQVQQISVSRGGQRIHLVNGIWEYE